MSSRRSNSRDSGAYGSNEELHHMEVEAHNHVSGNSIGPQGRSSATPNSLSHVPSRTPTPAVSTAGGGDDDEDENVAIDEGELNAVVDLIAMENKDEVRSYEEVKEAQKQQLELLRTEEFVENQPLQSNGNGGAKSQAEVIDHRLQYLMKQSEIFAHFMTGGPPAIDTHGDGDANGKPNTRKRKSMGPSKASRSRGTLGRSKTEEEEDSEMMRAAASNSNVTWLGEQPRNIVGGAMRPCKLLSSHVGAVCDRLYSDCCCIDLGRSNGGTELVDQAPRQQYQWNIGR
jgi:hypothetical protein